MVFLVRPLFSWYHVYLIEEVVNKLGRSAALTDIRYSQSSVLSIANEIILSSFYIESIASLSRLF